MDWDNNPRIDIERRIKQLELRITFLRRFTGLGSIDYENSQAVRFYPSLMPKAKRERARRLIAVCNKEHSLKWKQLKTF